MSPRRPLVPLLGLLLCPCPVLAQEGAAASPVAAPEQTGLLSVIVFDLSGLPVAGARVRVDGASATTDADGHAALSLSPGTVDLVVEGAGRARTLRGLVIAPDMTTEALVTLLPPDRVAAEVESPDPAVVDRSGGPSLAGPTGTVTGTVRDEAGAPVVGARVFVRGQPAEATTDAGGAFSLALPVGTHELSVVRSGFATQELPGVVVEEGRATAAAPVALVETGLTLTYEVTAPRIEGGTASLLEERRDSTNVAEVLGAEEMAKSGDASAASALKRVTGLTVVGGKYVYVRGLGERYSSTLLNGSMLPSPEPERRVVPLDLFPTSILESVVIQKTFSPDMPAEFGGGTIALRTKSVPEELIVEVGVSGAWTQGATWTEGLVAPGGSTDWLGMDDGSRALPQSVQEASDGQPLEEGDMFSDAGYSAEELEALGEAIPNRWTLERQTLPADLGADLVVGHGVGIADDQVRFGGLVGVNYGNDWDRDVYDKTYYLLGAGGALEEAHTYAFETVTNEVTLGGIGVVGVELFDDHTITFTNVLARSTDDEARVYEGINRDVGSPIRVSRMRYLERQLWYHQLRGEHGLPWLHLPGADGIEVEWRYAWATAQRREPDRREWRQDYEENTGEWLLSDRPEGNQIVHSTLDDSLWNAGADLTVPVPFLWALQGKVKGGFDWMGKAREVDTRRYKYMHKGERANADAVLSLPPDQVFVPENIGTDGFQFEEITRKTDNYQAEQSIDAWYGMVELPVSPSTRIMGGVRSETSRQYVKTFELFNPDNAPAIAELETTDTLPAVTVTQELPAEMQVRAGYGKTVSRPDFRELSQATFNDVTGGRQVYGNPDLERATIDNVDLRWEWYPRPGESFSVGTFYKRFTRPIENVVIVGGQISLTYENADSATDLGVEVDWRRTLDFLGSAGESLYVAGNVAWIRSAVELGDAGAGASGDSRPLQGQSPYVLNLQLGWDDVDRGTRAALLYNSAGRRIQEVGTAGAPDIYQLPVHQLDLVASQALPAGLTVSLKAKNLLDWPRQETQGELVTESLREGWSLGAGLSWAL